METPLTLRLGVGFRFLVRNLLLDPVRAGRSRRPGCVAELGDLFPVCNSEGSAYGSVRITCRIRDEEMVGDSWYRRLVDRH